MATVRAKFTVVKSELTVMSPKSDLGYRVTLQPVYDSDPKSENGQFYKFTPGGKIELETINAAAAASLKIGTEVYVDFTPVG